jgi:exoribonuclease-2
MDNLTTIARKAMIEHGLQPDFSPEAQRQAESSSHARPKTPAIRDLRALLWSSIDNDDTRDLDQLVVAEPLDDAAVKIMVAVADVDALVAHRSAIDDHARGNTTSVYTAAKIFPMLPEKLSTDRRLFAKARNGSPSSSRLRSTPRDRSPLPTCIARSC